MQPVWFCYKNDSLLRMTVARAQGETAAPSPYVPRRNIR
jgi:hypothetical protein